MYAHDLAACREDMDEGDAADVDEDDAADIATTVSTVLKTADASVCCVACNCCSGDAHTATKQHLSLDSINS
jgi:hypothetical protein